LVSPPSPFSSLRAERSKFPQPRSLSETTSIVLTSKRIQKAIKEDAELNKCTAQQSEARARGIIDKMFGDPNLKVVGNLGWFFRKIWRQIYEGILVEKKYLPELQAAAKKGPILYLPSHRSYVDFLVMSYVCLACNLPLPHIAAGEDFLGILFVRWLFRKSGAFFIRRSFLGSKPLSLSWFLLFPFYFFFLSVFLFLFLFSSASR
jgi:glycerol-3-phosphate O-acyltransferase